MAETKRVGLASQSKSSKTHIGKGPVTDDGVEQYDKDVVSLSKEMSSASGDIFDPNWKATKLYEVEDVDDEEAGQSSYKNSKKQSAH